MSNDNQNSAAQESVLLSTFYCGRKRFKLYFHRNQIVWDYAKPPYAQHSVSIEDVISVQYKCVRTGPGNDVAYDPYYFIIHYAEQKKPNVWRYNSLTLRHCDALQVSSWVKTLQNHLQKFCKRPKRLLLFVNPVGGKRRAMHIYERYAKPLFHIAGIDVSVIVSQRQNQIRDFLIHHNLDMFDSIACVGGDGTVSEVFNGLVMRECRLHGVDPDEAVAELPRPSMPIGIIPAGSTDTIIYCLHGTTDVTTAVMNIILGDSLGLDLVSVHDSTRLLRLYASILSYGYLGDIAHNSESFRWMGPSRYEYCGFKNIMANKGYNGEISILCDEDNIEQSKCCGRCDQCSSQHNGLSGVKKVDRWKTVQGKFFMINAANISCACIRSPYGIAPYCHLGDGYLHLVLVRHTSLVNNLRILSRYVKRTYTTDDLPFVEVHRAKEITFHANDAVRSHWNCDGEVQHQSDIHARVHCQLINVFTRGSSMIADESNNKCNFCRFCKI